MSAAYISRTPRRSTASKQWPPHPELSWPRPINQSYMSYWRPFGTCLRTIYKPNITHPDRVPRLSARVLEERAEARLQIREARQALAEAQLEDAIALAVDAGLSWRELGVLIDIDRRVLSEKWGHRRNQPAPAREARGAALVRLVRVLG